MKLVLRSSRDPRHKVPQSDLAEVRKPTSVKYLEDIKWLLRVAITAIAATICVLGLTVVVLLTRGVFFG